MMSKADSSARRFWSIDLVQAVLLERRELDVDAGLGLDIGLEILKAHLVPLAGDHRDADGAAGVAHRDRRRRPVRTTALPTMGTVSAAASRPTGDGSVAAAVARRNRDHGRCDP